MEILPEEAKFGELLDKFHQKGEVMWIGIRPKRGESVEVLQETKAVTGGLVNDHYNTGNPDKKRQVTVIQQEYLAAVASFLGKENIDPALIRRNIVIKGINLNSLAGRQFMIGEAILEMTGHCHPCDLMEKNLGYGGYNAMRGHGGFTCRVIKEGIIRTGDKITVLRD